MKYLFIFLSVFACGTLFAQNKNTKPQHFCDTIFKGVNRSYTEFDGNRILNTPPYTPVGSSGSFYRVYNPWKDNFPDFTWSKDTLNIIDLSTIKFIKMPTGEVYKIVCETKLERVFETITLRGASSYYFSSGDTTQLRSPIIFIH